MDINDEVTRILSEQLKIPVEGLSSDTRLDELGVESLDMIEIIYELEAKFDISIPLDQGGSSKKKSGGPEPVVFETIEDVVNGVKAAVAAAARP